MFVWFEQRSDRHEGDEIHVNTFCRPCRGALNGTSCFKNRTDDLHKKPSGTITRVRCVIPEAQLHNTGRGYWGRRAALFTWQPHGLHKHKEMIGLENRMKVLIT
ncbi:unnamed protein product [Leuciscus chuanchicus]